MMLAITYIAVCFLFYRNLVLNDSLKELDSRLDSIEKKVKELDLHL